MMNTTNSFNKTLMTNKEIAKTLLSMTSCIKGFKPILTEKLVIPDKFTFIWMDDYEEEVKVRFY